MVILLLVVEDGFAVVDAVVDVVVYCHNPDHNRSCWSVEEEVFGKDVPHY